MLTATTQLTQRAIERLQETASQGREKWLWLALATVAHRDRARDHLRGADRAPDPPARPGDPPDGHAPTSRTRSQVNGPQDLRYLGQRLEWLRTRLHELEQQQTRFLRHVSHELKTPLTAVREGAELLRDNVGGRLSPEQQDIVRIVRENTLSLQKLIEDLLDLSPDARAGAGDARPGALADDRRARDARAEARRHRAHDRRSTRRLRRRSSSATPSRSARSSTTCCRTRSSIRRARARSRSRSVEQRRLRGARRHRPRARHRARRARARLRFVLFQGTAPADGKVKGSGLGLAIAREYAIAQAGRIEVLDRTDGERGVRFRAVAAAVAGRGDAAHRGSDARPCRPGPRSDVASRIVCAAACVRLARRLRDRAGRRP